MTIYVSRVGGTGAINGVYAIPQYPGQESLQDIDPETLAYLAGQAQPSGMSTLLARVAALETQMAAVVAVPVVAAGLPAPTPTPSAI